jgi:hypothetical protein
MSKYDDATWHYDGDYPQNLPEINGATHIGMFLTWCINNNLLSKEQNEDNAEDIVKVKNRKLTGAEYLINNCDEKFADGDLNTIGNRFTKAYYEYSKKTKFSAKYADYLVDYAKLLNNSSTENDLYEVENSWSNYDLLQPIIDQRFKEWQEFVKAKKK